METNPIAPRQRNRRADRSAENPPAQQMQQPVQPPVYQSPVQVPAQPVYPQTPRTMYQQPYPPVQPVQQPVRPAPQTYPQMQQVYPQGGYQQVQQLPPTQPMQRPQVQPVQSQPVQYAPRPRVLNQAGPVNSGWQQPTLTERAEVPHARAGRSLSKETAKANRAAQKEAAAQARREAQEKAEWEAEKARRAAGKSETEKPAKKKLPGWLTTAMSLMFVAVLALGAAYWLMQAYLTTQENARIAAYQAVLDNYHVTEQADGTLKVTWQDYIEKYAAQYNLQPAFVTAIIRNESSFRTNAESSVGARGLMQMMPDTAEWIAGKLDDYSYTFDRMWDAETNIRYGCWYLGYLSRLFRGDPVLVSAAYHAGQTTVTQWLSDPQKSRDGVTLDLDKLSDGPTKQYIGRVTQTYGIYQSLLYPDEAFGAADNMLSAGSASSAAAGR